jgi:hypothetical protein
MGRIAGLQIIDVAPILLRSLGLTATAEMEGAIPEGLFEDPAPSEAVRDHEPVAQFSEENRDTEVHAEVLKRLCEIGYIEQGYIEE